MVAGRHTVIPIRGHGITLGVVLGVTAYIRVIEVVHERTHGVAVIGCELSTLLGQTDMGFGQIRILPVEGSRVNNKPGVGEERF